MSYLSRSNGPRYVKVRCALTSNQSLSVPLSPYYPKYEGDILLNGDNVNVVSDYLPLSGCLAIGDIQGQVIKDDSFRIARPVNTPYDSLYDWQNYGSSFSVFQAFYKHEEPPDEKNVLHTKFGGSLRDIPNDDLYDYSGGLGLTLNGYTLRRYSVLHPELGVLDTAVSNGFNANGFLSYALSSTQGMGHPFYEYLEWLQWTTDRVNTGQIYFFPLSGWSYAWANMTNLSFQKGNHVHIELLYEFIADHYAFAIKTVYNVHVNVELFFEPVFGSDSPFTPRIITPHLIRIVDNSVVDVGELVGNALAPPDLTIPWRIQRLPYTNTDISIFSRGDQSIEGDNTDNFQKFLSSKTGTPSGYHRSFTHYVRNRFDSIQPSGFYAADDALDTQIEVLKANNLENLTQLSGILSLLPPLPKLAEFVAKAVDGDPGVLVDLVDYVTSTILHYRFDTSTTVSDAAEIASSDLISKLKQLLASNAITSYGKFAWVKPDNVPFWGDGKLVLVTRAKLRFSLDASTLLADYLSADASGLMPSLSRCWDLVPFSFVVDWFANEGERLHAIDDQLLFAFVGVQWVLYSYKLLYFPSDSELSAFGLENPNPDDLFHISVYIRELSLYVPRLRDSEFDFLAAKKPNLLTVGSFLWQSLRSV
jgi:hypothetical protein